MSAPGDWSWGITVPDNWITVDVELPAADRRGELVSKVEELVAKVPELAEDAVRLVDIAHAEVSHAVDHDALFVSVGFEHIGVDLVAMSAAGYGLYGEHPPDLAALVSKLSEERPQDVNGREVELVDLPVGPAVRVHIISDSVPVDGQAMLIEGVDHFIPVPKGTDVLLLSCSTPSVAVGDMVLPVFDEIAATVELEIM